MPRDRGQRDAAGALKFGAQPAEPAAIIGQLRAMVHGARSPLIDPTAVNLNECRDRLDEVAGMLRTLLAGLPGRHMAACMVSGYTADGMPAAPEPGRRVSLEV